MHLVSALLSGFPEAKNGTVNIYFAGTATPSGWYEDFFGLVPGTGTLELDEYGAVEVYVNRYVSVDVLDADGVVVASFVEGSSAPVVELRSLSFDGTDYVSGVVAPGNPLTVKAAFDLWINSAGATNFNVLGPSGVMSLQDLAGNATGIYFNVRNTAYAGGAQGDGVSDDLLAVGTAILACEAAGGGIVFFPAGTYRLSDTITIPDGVSLEGVGDDVVTLVTSSVTAPLITFEDGLDVTRRVKGLTMTSLGTNSAALVSFDAVNLEFSDCSFGTLAHATAGYYDDCLETITATNPGTSKLTFDRCKFFIAPGDSLLYLTTVTTEETQVRMDGCEVKLVAGTGSVILYPQGPVYISDCIWDIDGVTGSVTCVDASYGGVANGNSFSDALTATTITAFVVPAAGTGLIFVESGNRFGEGGNPAAWYPYETTGDTDSLLQSLDAQWIEIVSNANPLALWAPTSLSPYATYLIHRTAAGNQTVNIGNVVEGATYTLLIWNDNTGGAINTTFGTGIRGTGGATSPTNNTINALVFKGMNIGNGLVELVQVSGMAIGVAT
jgi:hypothetical protein